DISTSCVSFRSVAGQVTGNLIRREKYQKLDVMPMRMVRLQPNSGGIILTMFGPWRAGWIFDVEEIAIRFSVPSFFPVDMDFELRGRANRRRRQLQAVLGK